MTDSSNRAAVSAAPRLLVVSDRGHREIDIGDCVRIGRHPDNDICLEDPAVSKFHGEIRRRRDGFVFIDLHSRNGSFKAGVRVQGDVPLAIGDDIAIGSYRLMLVEPVVGRASRASRASPGAAAPSAGVTILEDAAAPPPIHASLDARLDDKFLPESQIKDGNVLRRDYERLRLAYELHQAIGTATDLEVILARIVEVALVALGADRGVVLLQEGGKLTPRIVKTREPQDHAVVLSKGIIQAVIDTRSSILSKDALRDPRFNRAASVILQSIRSSMAVPLLHGDELLGVMVLDSVRERRSFHDKDLLVFTSLANQCASLIANRQMHARLAAEGAMRQKFRRLLSPVLAERLLSGEMEVQLGGERHEASVLFADIRGFTSMSERQSAEQTLELLNQFFARVVNVVFAHEGTLDKFIGDAVMVLFGVPIRSSDHAARAISTGLALQNVIAEFSTERRARGLEAIAIGVGICSGPLVAGYVGSPQVMEYTAIGDTVNTASRLCSLAGAGEVLVGAETHRLAGPAFSMAACEPVQIKGKREPLAVYRVLERRAAQSTFTAADLTIPGQRRPI